MAKKFFGTDGIRGRAGEGKLSRDNIAAIGLTLGRFLSETSPRSKVIIGRDTRSSGHWIEHVLITGLSSFGIDTITPGVLPTAAVSFLTKETGAALGIMITASHNPYHDNGIKLFGPDGRKISDESQDRIEALLGNDTDCRVEFKTGQTLPADQKLTDQYKKAVLASLPKGLSFSGLKVVLDTANGAAFETGAALLKTLGVSELHLIGASPTGENINLDCGSTHPKSMSEKVLATGAHIGIAMDGDADRLTMCDEKGEIIDGDQIMGTLALAWRDQGRLNQPALVATVMSNLGLERAMKAENIELIRTKVGDRHVAAAMKKSGYNLGGEQSGHMLMPDFLPTGDGMLAALQVLSVLAQKKQKASRALRVFKPVPQLLVNVRYDGGSPLTKPEIKTAIGEAHEAFGDQGRLLIRASGTEPVIRVMTEGDDPEQVRTIAHNLADIIRNAS